MVQNRLCAICNSSINNLRRDAKTCSSSCRGKLFRANQAKYVVVRFNVPQSAYTDLIIKVFNADKTIDSYLCDLVMKA